MRSDVVVVCLSETNANMAHLTHHDPDHNNKFAWCYLCPSDKYNNKCKHKDAAKVFLYLTSDLPQALNYFRTKICSAPSSIIGQILGLPQEMLPGAFFGMEQIKVQQTAHSLLLAIAHFVGLVDVSAAALQGLRFACHHELLHNPGFYKPLLAGEYEKALKVVATQESQFFCGRNADTRGIIDEHLDVAYVIALASLLQRPIILFASTKHMNNYDGSPKDVLAQHRMNTNYSISTSRSGTMHPRVARVYTKVLPGMIMDMLNPCTCITRMCKPLIMF